MKLIARDPVEHYDKRCEAMEGKAMVVVMSRRIAVELYRELVALRPDWHGEDDDSGSLTSRLPICRGKSVRTNQPAQVRLARNRSPVAVCRNETAAASR